MVFSFLIARIPKYPNQKKILALLFRTLESKVQIRESGNRICTNLRKKFHIFSTFSICCIFVSTRSIRACDGALERYFEEVFIFYYFSLTECYRWTENLESSLVSKSCYQKISRSIWWFMPRFEIFSAMLVFSILVSQCYWYLFELNCWFADTRKTCLIFHRRVGVDHGSRSGRLLSYYFVSIYWFKTD